nr:uncharacterized protein LOC129278314 [Lytechinus pictus]
MASVVFEDDQDDLLMDCEYEETEDGAVESEEDGESNSSSSSAGGSDDSASDENDGGERDSDGEDGDIAADGEGARRRIVPWEYEPLPRGEPGENVGDAGLPNDRENRIHGNVEEWCTCGCCRIEPSFNAGDHLCCSEVPEVRQVAEEYGATCLTETREFEPAILNPVSLYIGWLEYTERWRRAARSFADRNNEKYRYVAYRKVVRWCWGYLGKDIRVQLPACVHSKIMTSYPDGGGQYKGTILRRLEL